MLDSHIHIQEGPVDREGLLTRLAAAGQAGGLLLSLPPDSFAGGGRHRGARERLDNLAAWRGDCTNLHGFFWIDPTEPDAPAQVAEAVGRGVQGFKIVCDRFYPGDARAMPVYRAIAAASKPILFHSGILWDGQPSSRYNRPSEWEELLSIGGLRFALAHVSWPWCDECIAVYGKFLNAFERHPERAPEMFIDLTPGTPTVYREEVLTKLFGTGYDIEDNLMFGSDCDAGAYNDAWTRDWIARDGGIYARLGVGEDTGRKIHGENLLRFLGFAERSAPRRGVKPAAD